MSDSVLTYRLELTASGPIKDVGAVEDVVNKLREMAGVKVERWSTYTPKAASKPRTPKPETPQ